jgi:hypothetical protein
MSFRSFYLETAFSMPYYCFVIVCQPQTNVYGASFYFVLSAAENAFDLPEGNLIPESMWKVLYPAYRFKKNQVEPGYF